MPRITQKELLAITTKQVGLVVRDDGGLFGRVRVKADNKLTIPFYYRYRHGDKLHDISCGSWPHDSLAQIREARDAARDRAATGADPATVKKVQKIEVQEALEAKLAQVEAQREAGLTVRDMFDVWLLDGVRRRNDNAELKRQFNADVLPKIGGVAVRALTEHDLRHVLRTMVARGANRSAVSLRNNLKQMLNWAQKRQPWRRLLVEGNPMDLIEIGRIVSPDFDPRGVRERVLSPAEIHELHTVLDRARKEYAQAANRRIAVQPIEITTECAIWIMLSTMCRVGELTMARWEHVSFERAEWFIPKENVKDRISSLTISLSDFALRYFRRLYDCSGDTDWCFPNYMGTLHISPRAITKQISDRQTMFKHGRDGGPRAKMPHRRQDDRLVLQNGKYGAWTAHDLRRTGATLMQSLGITLDVIDRCQNHVLAGSKVRRHYLHYDYAREKREAWNKLGRQLEAIVNAEIVAALPDK